MIKQNIFFSTFFVLTVLMLLLSHLSIVDSISMEPTLLSGDIVLCSRVADVHEIKINDVIIFRSLEDDSTLLVKRFFDIIQPSENHVMYDVRGDNKDGSCDSRNFGYVPAKKINGKVFMILISWDSYKKSFRSKRFFVRM